jgi:hypothetical protein
MHKDNADAGVYSFLEIFVQDENGFQRTDASV